MTDYNNDNDNRVRFPEGDDDNQQAMRTIAEVAQYGLAPFFGNGADHLLELAGGMKHMGPSLIDALLDDPEEAENVRQQALVLAGRLWAWSYAVKVCEAQANGENAIEIEKNVRDFFTKNAIPAKAVNEMVGFLMIVEQCTRIISGHFMTILCDMLQGELPDTPFQREQFNNMREEARQRSLHGHMQKKAADELLRSIFGDAGEVNER
jgi:hypothetical protein